MTYLLVVFLIVLVIPLLAASWRVSLLGLAVQGLLLGWMAIRTEHELTPGLALVIIDTMVLRGLLAPWFVGRALSGSDVPRRNDVIPPNLFSWALVAALIFVSFRFAAAVPPPPVGGSLMVAVGTAAVLLGLFVLASQNGMLSQIVGLLRLENAIGLFELQLDHHFVLPVQLALTLVLLATVIVCARLLRGELRTRHEAEDRGEEPTL